ncbi:hypothetical protein CDD83_2602 [Cordyceps sp. RAO-2017]|nr:hypothetical protein CDD83_2602 [Cordyceps sp. RAO-2017]
MGVTGPPAGLPPPVPPLLEEQQARQRTSQAGVETLARRTRVHTGRKGQSVVPPPRATQAVYASDRRSGRARERGGLDRRVSASRGPDMGRIKRRPFVLARKGGVDADAKDESSCRGE